MNMGMPQMGGPVGGPIMNNGGQPNEKILLNTYIYDYFLKHHMYDCAQAILREGEVMTNGSRRASPSRRSQKLDADGNIMTNGMDDAMENVDGSGPRKTEDGEDAKQEFPLPNVQGCPQGCFLLDWWVLFWDIFGIRTNQKPGTLQATQYLHTQHAQQRLRQQHEQIMLQRISNPQQAGLLQGQVSNSVMNPGPGYQNPMLRQPFPNGVIVGQDGLPAGMGPEGKQHLVRQALMNNNNKRAGPPAPGQLNALQKQQQQMMQQAQRDQDVDMNGQQPRPQSPAGSQAAASPGTKRRNLGGGDYQEIGGPATRVQMPTGAPGTAQASQAQQILLANGIDPNRLTPQQFAAFQVQNPGAQQRSIALYAQSLAQHAHQQRTVLQQGMPKGIPHVQGNPAGNNGSPMISHNGEGAPMNMIPEFYGAAGKNIGQGPGTGNHALQDYQMQLMLLEQQNKKRLLIARQEQDNLQGRAEGQSFSGMSPQGGRAAPSPGPQGGDMKRGTPKMNPQAGPGSPLPDGQMSGQQQRGSPATSMPGFNGQVQLDTQGMFYTQNKINEMLSANGANGAMMRAPGPHANFNGQMNTQQLQEQVMNNPNLRQQAGRGQPVGGNVWASQQPGMPNAHQALMQAQAVANAQQQAQQQAQNAPTPGQPRPNVNHTNMPPPSAPATQANGRAPSSPSVNNQQPPTPTQANKSAPKRKGEAKERKKKVNAAPVQANVATPSSEPPTPTTPVTPQHPNSFNSAVHKPNNFNTSAPGQVGNGAPNAQPTQQPQAPAVPPPMNPEMTAGVFNGLSEDSNIFGDFPGEAGNDTLLDNFDFDSFLNNPDEGGSAGLFDPSGFSFPEPVDTGAGES